MTLKKIKSELKAFSNSEKAAFFPRFFKTGPGQYGEGDVFIGVTVPDQRKIVKKYWKEISLADLQKLLSDKIHEYRLTALLILVLKYERGTPEQKEEILKFYEQNFKNINNWDLVDTSAPHIYGNYLLDKNRKKLYALAKSKSLWERRISILATFAFIKNNEVVDTLKIAKILLNDPHDLIHKAVGWMLRELGKKNLPPLLEFLNQHAHKMPRTMLRYAIEKLNDSQRRKYLAKKDY